MSRLARTGCRIGKASKERRWVFFHAGTSGNGWRRTHGTPLCWIFTSCAMKPVFFAVKRPPRTGGEDRAPSIDVRLGAVGPDGVAIIGCYPLKCRLRRCRERKRACLDGLLRGEAGGLQRGVFSGTVTVRRAGLAPRGFWSRLCHNESVPVRRNAGWRAGSLVTGVWLRWSFGSAPEDGCLLRS
jgi:hypothetical protein